MGSIYPDLVKNKIYLSCLVGLEIACCGISLPLYASPLASELTVSQQREQAVQLAKQGQVQVGTSTLKQLHKQYPQDAKVTADLIILLRLAGDNAAIARLTSNENLNPQLVAAYAYTAWLGALRDQKRAEQAFNIAQQIYKLNDSDNKEAQPPFDQWYYLTLAAEAGRTDVAQQLVNELKQLGGLTAAQHAQLAYAQRLSGNWQQAFDESKQALALQPNHRLALEQQFAALRSLNQPHAAYQLASQHPDIFSADTIYPIQAEVLSSNLQSALKQKDLLEAQGHYQQAHALVEDNLLALKQSVTQFKSTPQNKNLPEYAAIFNDYLYALRVQEYMAVLVAEYEQLSLTEQFELQPYAKNAVADAYLALKKPQQAHVLYDYLINNATQPNVELYIADYYALIEQDNYKQAAQLLNQLDQLIAVVEPTSTPTEKQNRTRVDQIIALDAAYRNHLDIAARQLQQLVQQNPNNTNLANDYATILNWRGLPGASNQVVQQAYINAPHHLGLDLTTVANARDLQDYPRWQAALATAAVKAPTNSSVMKAQQEWQDRERITLQSDLLIGRSRAVNGLNHQAISEVNGNREREWQTRVNSPWIDNKWRIFASHLDRSADFEPTQQRDQRIGVGAEWQENRKNAWLMLDQQRDTHQMGFELGWSHWLNDNWAYRLGYQQNSSQIPLRALEAGLEANSYQAGLNWSQNESKAASFAYQVLDISDGNMRQSVSARYNQRVFANAQHITHAGAEAYYDKNAQSGGNYFNPDHSASYGVNLEHDWTSWRKDQQSFTQHFELATGISQQAGFGAKSYTSALYQHEWGLSRTWQLHYGIGWGSQTYDANREQRTFAKLGITGAF